jgi:hypothetical protein
MSGSLPAVTFWGAVFVVVMGIHNCDKFAPCQPFVCRLLNPPFLLLEPVRDRPEASLRIKIEAKGPNESPGL